MPIKDNEKVNQEEYIKGIEKLTSYLNSINAGEIKIHNTSEYLNKLQNLSKFINEVLIIYKKIFFCNFLKRMCIFLSIYVIFFLKT